LGCTVLTQPHPFPSNNAQEQLKSDRGLGWTQTGINQLRLNLSKEIYRFSKGKAIRKMIR